MGIISECEFCFKVSNSNRTYTKQTELYDGVLEVMMCQNCGYAAEFERERIIKLLAEMRDACLSVTTQIGDHNASTLENAIAVIKGGK